MRFQNLFLLFLTFVLCQNLTAQIQIKGVIVDLDQAPLAGVKVYEKDNSSNFTYSELNGAFALELLKDSVFVLDGSIYGYGIMYKNASDLYNDHTLVFKTDVANEISFRPIVVYSNWVNNKLPFTSQNINKTNLNKYNSGNDLPSLLQFETNLVHSSDAGAGIGYTAMRIRGSDATRINVTVNGVPINDAESQNVFWVNMSDIAASTEQLQIQRGVGPSTNGVGSFGASVGLNTLAFYESPQFSITQHFGSFNTRRTSASFNSGKLGQRGRIQFNGRFSKIDSDGYIDRASSDLSSYYLEAAYMSSFFSSRLLTFGGKEITYQAWNGLPIQYLNNPLYGRKYNSAGIISENSSYDNQVDDYQQTHYHWINTAKISSNLDFNLTFHYTRGLGFYEEFRLNDEFASYQLSPIVIGNELIEESDFIRRRGLDNHYGGLIGSLLHSFNGGSQRLGWGYNVYDGEHFGHVLWSKDGNVPPNGHEYYLNNGLKHDANVFYSIGFDMTNNLSLYTDLQYRHVNVKFDGQNRDLGELGEGANLNFFNPKLGLVYAQNTNEKYYLSMAIANKEPNRRDYVDSPKEQQPLPERLYNLELGFEKTMGKFSYKINGYLMYYKDQLVLNGQINDVGAYARINVDKSYRMGVETSAIWNPTHYLSIYSNLSLSQNRVLDFYNYVDVWDDEANQREEYYKTTPIAFSPAAVATVVLDFKPRALWQGKKILPSSVSIDWKYVGKQYLDNTGDNERALAAYDFANLRVAYGFDVRGAELNVFASINNIFSKLYSSNGWVYAFDSPYYNPLNDDPHTIALGGDRYAQIGLFPQAPLHFNIGVNIVFKGENGVN